MTHLDQGTEGAAAPTIKRKTAVQKNPRGTGSTYQQIKNGRVQWVAAISVREEAEDGTIKRRYIRGFGETEALAIKARSAAISRRMKGQAKNTGDRAPRLSKLLDRWLDPSNGYKLGDESRRKYRNDITRHVIDVLGDPQFNHLNKEVLTTLFHKTLPQNGVGQSAIYHTFINFNTLMNWCVKQEIIDENPMDHVERVAKSNASASKDRELINQRTNMFLRFLEKLDDEDHPYHEHRLMFLFMSLGLRRAELLGLEWGNSVKNLNKKDSCYLLVKQQLGFITGQGFYIKPHTKNLKERTVYLPEEFRKDLIKHKREQEEKGLKGNGEFKDLVFTSGNSCISYNLYSTLWRRAWDYYLTERDKKKYFRPHYVRHIAASILLEKTNGNIVLVQDILGHSDAAMALHYSHQMEETRKNAAKALASGLKVQRKGGVRKAE